MKDVSINLVEGSEDSMDVAFCREGKRGSTFEPTATYTVDNFGCEEHSRDLYLFIKGVET